MKQAHIKFAVASAAALALATLGFAAPSFATSSPDIPVSVTVPASVTISALTPDTVNFGTVAPDVTTTDPAGTYTPTTGSENFTVTNQNDPNDGTVYVLPGADSMTGAGGTDTISNQYLSIGCNSDPTGCNGSTPQSFDATGDAVTLGTHAASTSYNGDTCPGVNCIEEYGLQWGIDPPSSAAANEAFTETFYVVVTAN